MENELAVLEHENAITPVRSCWIDHAAMQHEFRAQEAANRFRSVAESPSSYRLRDPCLRGKLVRFPGGGKKPIGAGQLLIAEADLLLLDEPTNHLDIRSNRVA
jgi:ATP-binding cassette subfamily F protein uup